LLLLISTKNLSVLYIHSIVVSLFENLSFSLYDTFCLPTRLMVEILSVLKDCGYRQVSLAVQKANYAVRMYENVGFTTVNENEEEYIMVCVLRESSGSEKAAGRKTVWEIW